MAPSTTAAGALVVKATVWVPLPTAKDWLLLPAAWSESPAWLALMVQVPGPL